MTRKQSHYMQSDLLIIFILFVVTSLVAIYNAEQLAQYETEDFMNKQVVWFTAGVLIAAAMQFFDMDQLYKASVYVYAAGVLALVLLYISPTSIAYEVNGAKSWFNNLIPGFSLQPAEFVKITTIIYLASTITTHRVKHEGRTTSKTDTILLLKLIGITALPVFFILLQPDFGTAMVYVFILGMMIIFSGINWKIILSLVGIVGALLGLLLGFIIQFADLAKAIVGPGRAYQIDRILTWFDPTQSSDAATWHFDRAFMGLGSGQLFGKGIGGVEVYYPEAQTDFIFSIIGETFGFIGGAFVIFLYFMLLYKLVSLGMKVYEFSPFSAYFCLGYLSLILVHAFQNIGMTIGIMPVTGIPLPLISYGGSSVMATMFGLGIVYRIAVEHTIQSDYLFK